MTDHSNKQVNNFITAGTMAERLGVPLHKIQYVLRSRNIKPVGKAGTLRVYSEAQVDEVAENLETINERKGGAA